MRSEYLMWENKDFSVSWMFQNIEIFSYVWLLLSVAGEYSGVWFGVVCVTKINAQ